VLPFEFFELLCVSFVRHCGIKKVTAKEHKACLPVGRGFTEALKGSFVNNKRRTNIKAKQNGKDIT
jgi:hypothetical protein